MTKVPSLNYEVVVRALQRAGWVVVRQRGSHVRLQKHLPDETLKLTLPLIVPSRDPHSLTSSSTLV